MPEGDSLVVNLAASPASPAFHGPHGEGKPRDDVTSPLSFTAAAEGPAETLRSLPFLTPPLHRKPSAARGVFLFLVYSVAAAAAFLLALCFRRLRPKEGALLGGPQSRFLAGQQHPWGPPEDDNEEEDEFLSNTLEACLDMESDLGLPPAPSQPMPISEPQAISNIMWDLRDAAVLFEHEQTKAQQPAQGFLQAPRWQPGAAEPTHPGPMAGYEGDHWLGPEGWMWDLEDLGASMGPDLFPTPSTQTPPGATGSSHLVSLPETPPIITSPAASAATAATAAAPAQTWQQQQGGFQGTGGSPGTGGFLESESFPGTFAPPAPSAGSAAVPELSFLLQQQQPTVTSGLLSPLQQQQPSGSQGAAASGDSGASSVSLPDDKAGGEAPPTKKRKRDGDKTEEGSPARKASGKRPHQAHSQSDPSSKAAKAAAANERRRRFRAQGLTVALFTYQQASSSGVGEVAPSEEVSPSTSGVSAPGPSGSAQASSSSKAKRKKRPPPAAPQVQPSSVSISDGFLTIRRSTGETVSFAHPPLPTPATAPAHYRLPLVPREAIRTRFRIEQALVGFIHRQPWIHLNAAWKLLQRPVLNSEQVEELVFRCQHLVRHLLTKHRLSVTHIDPSRAKSSLSMRFLIFEILVNSIQMLGPAMNPQDWFFQLVASVPTDPRPKVKIVSPTAFLNSRVTELLGEGLEELKHGRRPSMELTNEIKHFLFSPDSAPRSFPEWLKAAWRPTFQKPKTEDELGEGDTSSDED
ncbi:hypothetical protein Emed_001170 [Eimeria media]